MVGGQGELQVDEEVAERTRDVATAALHRRVVRGVQDVWTETRKCCTVLYVKDVWTETRICRELKERGPVYSYISRFIRHFGPL